MKILRAILLAGSLAVPAALLAEPANAIRAVVHDAVITSQEVDFPAVSLIPDLQRKHRNDGAKMEAEFEKIRDDSFNQLLERELILREFTAAGYSFPESMVEERVQKRIRRDYFGDRTKFIKTLQAEGITYEKFRQQTRERMIIEALTEKNVSHEIMISPHKIEVHYLAHKEEYKVEEQVKLRMITLYTPTPADVPKARSLAEDIVAKLKAGTAFAELADETANLLAQGRVSGGDKGWVQKYSSEGNLVLQEKLANVAFSLKPGEFSGIIETPEALFILLVEDKKEAHLKTLAEVREQIENEMTNQESARLRKQWLDRLKKKTFVRLF